MADYPYTQNSGSLKSLLSQIQTIGVPAKLSQKTLESLGFKSKNDRTIIGVFKAIGFIDNAGTPTQVWQSYRNRNRARHVLGTAIRKAYGQLFDVYDDAYRRDIEALRNFFSSHTSVGGKALQDMIKTFRALVDLADFDSVAEVEPEHDEETSQRSDLTLTRRTGRGITVNINLQLSVAATDNPKIYEAFFAAMKKHLLE